MLSPFFRYDSGLFNNFPPSFVIMYLSFKFNYCFNTCKQYKGMWIHLSLIAFNIFIVALHYIKICQALSAVKYMIRLYNHSFNISMSGDFKTMIYQCVIIFTSTEFLYHLYKLFYDHLYFIIIF
jgi:hypothetical protein